MADSISIIKTRRKFPSGCGPNAPKTGAAFRWLFQTRTQEAPQTRISPAKTPVVRSGSQRDRVLEALKVFRARWREIRRSNPEEARVDLKAFQELKQKLRLGNAKSTGPIPGVEVGDHFQYRAELVITGVHGKLQNGIDYALFKGRLIATCVVAREGYYDKMNDPNFLVYGGEGGVCTSSRGNKKTKMKMEEADQVMRAGNLALKNSIEVRSEVRVVRGVKAPWKKAGGVVYVYDGLYEVVEWRKKKGKKGNMVFEFDMRRKPGQKTINWKDYSKI